MPDPSPTPDPFSGLQLPLDPVPPDETFARRLRQRLAGAFDLPRGVTVSNLNVSPTTTHAAEGGEPTRTRRRLRHGDIGYVSLWVPDASRAEAFFAHVLGWAYTPTHGTEGRQVRGLNIEHGIWQTDRAHTLFLCAAVEDVDAAVETVRRAGGTADEPSDQPYGRLAECVDDQGTKFAVYTPPGGVFPPADADAPPGESPSSQGDVSYLTMYVVDSARARAFYGAVLGWNFRPGRVEDGWGTDPEVYPMLGMGGGHRSAQVLPMYQVDDVAATVARVRAAGGTATDPEAQPYGVTSECTDDQGLPFYLGRT